MPVDPLDDIVAELGVFRLVRMAQKRDDHQEALRLLAEHERRFPDSKLAEERMAARVTALCGTGRVTEAHALATSFETRYPSSAFGAAMKRGCPATRVPSPRGP